MRVPTTVKQLPYLAVSFIQRARLRWVKLDPPATFRLCYFTCKSYFRYLYCSIHSLSLVRTPCALEILVFCDQDEMLSAEQISSLNGLGFPVRVIPWRKSQGWGTEQIASIWEAYALAATDAPEGAYVARVDSDLFFFSGWVFDTVAKSGADLVGDGHFVDFEYCQGGLYFFRADAVRRVLAATPTAEFGAELHREGIVVEDVAASFLARKAGLSVWQVFLMMFPDEYSNAGSLTPFQRLKFACLHYAKKDKRPMIDIYLDQIVAPKDRADFLSVLET